MSCALDSGGQLTLMLSAGAGNTTGNNLSAVGKVSSQTWNVLVVDVMNLIYTESANLFSALSAARSVVALSLFKSHSFQLLYYNVCKVFVFLEGEVIVIIIRGNLKIARRAAGVRNSCISIVVDCLRNRETALGACCGTL